MKKLTIISLISISLIFLTAISQTNQMNLKSITGTVSSESLDIQKIKESNTINGWITATKVTVSMTPDGSFSLMKEIISKATSYIYMEIYQFWSDEIFNLINQTLHSNPSIKVRILIENDTSQRGVVNNPDKFNLHYAYKFYSLAQQGFDVEVRLETSYNYFHGKIVIVDGQYVLISSENFIPTSFPSDPTHIKLPKYGSYYYHDTPSRGWVALIEGSQIAQFYLNIFNSDFTNGEIYDPAVHGTGVSFDSFSSTTFTPLPKVNETQTNVIIKPVASPFDSWGNITDLLLRANHTILIEVMYIYESAWGLVDILKTLHNERGVTIYIILEDDFSGYSYDPVQVINNLTSMGFHVVPAFNRDESIFLHNKGIIVDDRLVFVGSINWSGGSFNKNREFGVIIDSREIASFLRSVYEFDWEKSRDINDYPFDSDGDGLPDYYEIEHGLDRLSVDTDGDGLTDYDEVYIKGTDPLKPNIIKTKSFTVHSPVNETLTNKDQIALKIYVNSTQVENLAIILNNQPSTTVSVNGQVGWYNVTVGPLYYGPNLITIESKNASDNTLDRVKVIVILDDIDPSITVSGVTNNSIYSIGSQPKLTWDVIDDHLDSTKVYLDGEIISIENSGSLTLDTKDPKFYTGKHNITVIASDKAGNVAKKVIFFSIDKPEIVSLVINPANGTRLYQEEINLRVQIEIKIVNVTSVDVKIGNTIKALALESKQGEKWIWEGKIKVTSTNIDLVIETTHYTFKFKLTYEVEKNEIIRFLYMYRYEILFLVIMLVLIAVRYVRRR